MLVDEIILTCIAGNGGRGAAAFNKTRLNRGPTGGDGGRGGCVYFQGVTDPGALMPLANRKEVVAESGKDGRGQFLDGRQGEDLIIKVPTGTVVTNLETGFVREIEKTGDRLLVAGGGVGGRGNFKFRSSINTSPQEYEEGTQGDRATYKLELKLIADVGLVGLPSAGKSSLLNELTKARSKVGAYPFTTLEPHLGDFYGLIIADIPGLIEGASEGRGLGTKFLRHIERTRVLFHLIAADSADVVKDYRTIRAELAAHNPRLAEKKEYVFLAKSDEVSPEVLKSQLAKLKKAKVSAMPVSILEAESVERVRALLTEIRDSM